MIAYRLLTGAFLLTAVLAISHVRLGLFTDYAADLFVPAWMYFTLRGLGGARAPRIRILRVIGSSPALSAGALFLGAAGSEICQLYWPRGVFAGVFDPWDFVAYGTGLLACFLFDSRQVDRVAVGNA